MLRETGLPRDMQMNKCGKNNLGGIVVLTALMAFALVAIIALVIDLGRLQFLKRQLQNAADAAALAGVNQLRSHSPPDVEIDEWQLVKKGVLLALSRSSIGQLSELGRDELKNNPSAGGFVFGTHGQGEETCHDLEYYHGDSGRADNLSVVVRRGVFCYFDDSGTPKRRWCPLEGSLHNYCMANAVEVQLSITDVRASFARIFGLLDLIDMSASAIALMDPDPNNLVPSCGEFSDGSGLQVSVEANCFINWTQACRSATNVDNDSVCVSADPAKCAEPVMDNSVLTCVKGSNNCSLVWIDEKWQCRAPCPRSGEGASGCSPTNCPYYNEECSKG